MLDGHVLVDDWHPGCRSEDVGSGEGFGARLLNEDLVIWRDNGALMAWKDSAQSCSRSISRLNSTSSPIAWRSPTGGGLLISE